MNNSYVAFVALGDVDPDDIPLFILVSVDPKTFGIMLKNKYITAVKMDFEGGINEIKNYLKKGEVK